MGKAEPDSSQQEKGSLVSTKVVKHLNRGPERLWGCQPCKYLNSAAQGAEQPEDDGPALRGRRDHRPPEILSNQIALLILPLTVN